MPALSGPLPGTGVTPSAWNTCAERICGAAVHMPPVAPVGSLSTIVAFQASLHPGVLDVEAEPPHCARVIVAGPDLRNTQHRVGNLHLKGRSEVRPFKAEKRAITWCNATVAEIDEPTVRVRYREGNSPLTITVRVRCACAIGRRPKRAKSPSRGAATKSIVLETKNMLLLRYSAANW